MSSLRMSVIGSGVMGSGIAQSLAIAGYPTVCFDIAEEALDKARTGVQSGRFGLERSVEQGRLTQEAAEEAYGRMSFTTDLPRAADVDVIIECVPEDLGLKIRTFRELDAAAPAGAILASNTSGFPIGALAAATDRPDKVIGWHWASPPPVMKLAEIIVTEQTSETTVAVVREAAAACGKNPVVVKDTPMAWGFVANRIYGAMLREAQRVVDEGISTREDINQIMVDCFRWPVGPFAMVKGATSGWK